MVPVRCRDCGPARSYRRIVAVLLALTAGVAAIAAQSADEPPPAFRASFLLPASLLTGQHHQVAETVETETYLHEFTLTSDFGPFTAVGLAQLDTRIDEIRALAALDHVSKTEVFLEAAGGAVVNVGKGAASAVVDPVGTAKGIGAGIKRFGVNLGRASKRAMTTEGGADTGESTAEGAANVVFGVSSAMRRWAQKVGADPYTTNLVLRDALKSIAQVDAAGSIATKIVVPIPAVVGTTATVGDLVWSKDPEELRKLNETRARGFGVPDQAAAAFFRNGWFTLTMQTRLIAALDAVKRPGSADYIVAASAADTEPEAHFFVESAEMLKAFHARRPVDRLLTDSRAIVGLVEGGAVALVPADYFRSTRDSMDTITEIGGRARQELGARRLELQLTGRASARAVQDARNLGWTIAELSPRR
jgi:hypothetical protein